MSDHAVINAVLRVEKEGRRSLEAAAEGHEQIRCEIPLGEAGFNALGAIRCDVQQRLIERLLNPQVDDAGNTAQTLQNLVGPFAVALDVRADHLKVDRSRQAEVQNLGDHVGSAGKRR